MMSNSVSKNTRWCGETELLGTDGDSYQEGSWSTPGKERVWLSVINTVRSGRFSPGGTLQDDEFWGRTQSDNTLRVPCWNETLLWHQQTTKEAGHRTDTWGRKSAGAGEVEYVNKTSLELH